MPFQTSPCRDDGYDVSDYYAVDPRYGTLGDFVEFTHGAKQRGIRVIIDLVVNHTSDQHPWFQEARRDPNSTIPGLVSLVRQETGQANQGMVFPGMQKTTWTYDKEARLYYFHRFYEFQPDLNTSNPHVQAEILKIMGFWIQLGVSGFRMDAVPFIIGTKGANVEKPVEQYDMLRDAREFLQWRLGDSIILGEANILPETSMEYFGHDGDRLHMMFNFQVNQNLFYALAAADARPLVEGDEGHQAAPGHRRNGASSCATMTSSTSAGSPRSSGRPCSTPSVPRRTCSSITAASGAGSRPCSTATSGGIELAYSLLFTLPGTPVMRYGDELGMGDDLSAA